MSLLTKNSNDSLLKKGLEWGIIIVGGYLGGTLLLNNLQKSQAKTAADRLVAESIIAEGKTPSGQYSAVAIARMLVEALNDFDANENLIWKFFGSDKKPVGIVQSREFLKEIKMAYYTLTERKTTLEQDLKNVSWGWFRNYNSSDYQEILRSLDRINKRSRNAWNNKKP